MKEFFKNNLEKVISIIIILLLTYFLDLILDKIIDKVTKKKHNKNLTTVLLFLKKVKKFIIYLIGILICLSKFSMFSSFSVTLLSGLGITATVLGLAAKESLTNFFGSLDLIISHPFEVGDFIKIVEKNVIGTVEEISMRHTIIKTANNQREIIPNSVLNTLTVENYNHTDNEICFFGEYPIAYEADTDKAIKILKEEIKKLATPDDEKIEFPKVRVIKWDSSAIILRGWVWGKTPSEAYDNLWKLNYNLKKRFNEEKIEIPYDHLNVIIDK